MKARTWRRPARFSLLFALISLLFLSSIAIGGVVTYAAFEKTSSLNSNATAGGGILE